MTRISSEREFNLVKDSFSAVKNINLKDIGFNQISDSNLYIYQSDYYKILNYSIKPELIFSIKSEEDTINLNLQSISVKNLPNIFKKLNFFLRKIHFSFVLLVIETSRIPDFCIDKIT